MKKSRKNEILKMYFKNKMKPVDIAKKLNISKSAVTQQLQESRRYKKEKERRKHKNKEKNIEETKKIIKEKRKKIQMEKNQDNLILKNIHKTASIELSCKNRLSNLSYLNWNKSAYTYNEEKNRFEFRKNLGRSFDVPKFIKLKNRRKK